MKKMPQVWKYYRMAAIAVLLLGFALPAEAQRFRQKKKRRPKKVGTEPLHSYKYGLGLAMGAGVYSGINASYMLPNDAFIQAQVGVQILNAAFGSSVDYVLEFPNVISRTTVPYVGGGAIVVYGADYASLLDDAEGDFHFGVRAPLGIYMLLEEFPVQLFGEAIPGFLFAAETVPVLGVNLGFRWLFK